MGSARGSINLAVAPDDILAAFASTGGQLPRPLALSILGVGVSKAVLAADRAGVFRQLAGTAATAVELARATGCSLHGMQVLLESLEGFGFVQRRGESYRLTRPVAGWLDRDGGLSEGLLRLVGDNLQTLQPEDLTRSAPPDAREGPCWSDCLAMLKNSGHQSAAQLVHWAAALDPRHLLDVAGGGADNSLAFCRHHPRLRADVLEWPEIPPRRCPGGAERTHTIHRGDPLAADWGEGYDLVLLSNVLHRLCAQRCEAVLAKAFRALHSGGRVIVYDLFHPGARRRINPGIGLFSLIYFVTFGARSWPKPLVLEWLAGVGFANARCARRRLTLLVSAQKP